MFLRDLGERHGELCTWHQSRGLAASFQSQGQHPRATETTSFYQDWPCVSASYSSIEVLSSIHFYMLDIICKDHFHSAFKKFYETYLVLTSAPVSTSEMKGGCSRKHTHTHPPSSASNPNSPFSPAFPVSQSNAPHHCSLHPSHNCPSRANLSLPHGLCTCCPLQPPKCFSSSALSKRTFLR